MKKIFIVLISSILVGCSTGEIPSGFYLVEQSNEYDLYLIDLESGKRLAALEPNTFMIEIEEGKSVPSFTYLSIDPSQGNIENQFELGFFNAKLKETDITEFVEEDSQNLEAILIQVGAEIFNGNDNSLVASVISNIGPITYQKVVGNDYYFYLGANYLRVNKEYVVVLKAEVVEDPNESNFEDILFEEIAYNALLSTQRELVVTIDNHYVEQVSISNEGILIRDFEDTRDVEIFGKSVNIVTFYDMLAPYQSISVYIDINTLDVLGMTYMLVETDVEVVE